MIIKIQYQKLYKPQILNKYMLNELQKKQIAFTRKLNLNGLILDAITALEWNEGSMSWSYKIQTFKYL